MLTLLALLSQGPRRVEALARETSQTIANTSQHRQVLRGAHLVETEKRGLYVTYRLAGEAVTRFWRCDSRPVFLIGGLEGYPVETSIGTSRPRQRGRR